MNKTILPVIFIISVLFIAVGLIGDNKEANENSALTTVSNIQQLNDALKEGPVLVEIGTDTCPACIAQKPIMIDIANDYRGKATVIYINSGKSPALAGSFNIYSIPDIFVIAAKSDDGYIYMKTDGQTTNNRNEARFIGLTARKTLTNLLDAAIDYRQ
ncbi:thioredoxin family protein [Methanolobus psychrotolerans]|uniref:thioredoxin family protein n=1 Tax=Methanolobus psychrotolerans TaxID=1874706 RepID=UPI000B915DFC|nr:thioredoxin family protein [Methanolobus psychrotolerans]